MGHNMFVGSYLKSKEEEFVNQKDGRKELFNVAQNGLGLSGFCMGYL